MRRNGRLEFTPARRARLVAAGLGEGLVDELEEAAAVDDFDVGGAPGALATIQMWGCARCRCGCRGPGRL